MGAEPRWLSVSAVLEEGLALDELREIVAEARGDLGLVADISSDTASLYPSVRALLTAVPETRWMRDPTRGGLASSRNELAVGIDPLYVANQGKLVPPLPRIC